MVAIPIVRANVLRVVARILRVLHNHTLFLRYCVSANAANKLGRLTTEHGAENQLDVS